MTDDAALTVVALASLGGLTALAPRLLPADELASLAAAPERLAARAVLRALLAARYGLPATEVRLVGGGREPLTCPDLAGVGVSVAHTSGAVAPGYGARVRDDLGPGSGAPGRGARAPGRAVGEEPDPGSGAPGAAATGASGGRTSRDSLRGAVAVLSGPAPLGVDLEPAGRRSTRHVRARATTSGEQLLLEAADDPDAAFLRLWVRKEAVAKALGRGLAAGFGGLDVRAEVPVLGGAPLALRLHDVRVEGYVLAAALPVGVTLRVVDPSRLQLTPLARGLG